LWGGRWQNGAGAGAGEDMEQFFSYMSRWGSSTKNMIAACKIMCVCIYSHIRMYVWKSMFGLL